MTSLHNRKSSGDANPGSPIVGTPLSGAGDDGPAVISATRQELGRLRVKRFFLRALYIIVPFTALITIWYLAATYGGYPSYLFPPPQKVLATGIELLKDGTLAEQTWASSQRILFGSVAAIAVGLPLGVAMGLNRTVANYSAPLVTFFQAIPGIAWIPLAILWFGLGFRTATFIVFLSVFFPMLFNTLIGVRSVQQNMINAALTLGANKRQVITDVILPGALVNIVTGMRLGIGYGWRALVAVEILGASSGLGYMIFDARAQLKSDVVVLGMVCLGVIWLIVDSVLLKPLESRTIEKWGVLR